jgi:lipopolysaccharide export system protein LptA
MPLQVSRLRHWLAAATLLAVAIVAGAYFYARHRVQNALKQVPEKIGLEIQQSADGFSISRSEAGRTLFTIRASKAVQFKLGGHTELHDVAITLYGRDSNRFDQIYGSDFEYDPRSGEVSAKGEVQIDLEANPAGLTSSDQTTPKELKNPIHLKTSGLVFEEKTGDAYTKETVEFRVPQASGSALGMSYSAKGSVLTLQSQVKVVFNGPSGARIMAAHGSLSKEPRLIVLNQVLLQNGSQRFQADKATFFLRPDNTVGRVLARGKVFAESQGPQPAQVHAGQLEVVLAGERDLRNAVFSEGVQLESSGPQAVQTTAGRAVLSFAAKNVLTNVHMEENVKLAQRQKPSAPSAAAQDMELSAPAVDFFVTGGRRLERAETVGASQIALVSPGKGTTGQSVAGQQTKATAARFEARFDDLGQLSSVHGAPDARIVTSEPGQPDRVSTSDALALRFTPGNGVADLVQQGHVFYSDGERQAWADRARYTAADQLLVLTGSPRIVEGGATTTANSLRLNRATGDASADGDVKSTYSDLKPQPGGALLSSSTPIHVTARAMTLKHSSASAVYTGDARLWQDAHIVQAQEIEFDRDRRAMVARSTLPQGLPGRSSAGNASIGQSVSTVLIQTDPTGKVTPVTITSGRLSYTDSEHKAHFDGGVIAKAADFTVTASEMDIFLQARGQSNESQGSAAAAKLDRIVAQDQVVVTQPNRRATGNQLVYTASEDKFVLTGGPPSIFDAEHGKITGDSLTLFRRDDRVLVEGNNTSPSVTQTRVAR